ncbi:MAG: CoA pyrophosphatase [Proteobacteria bacterium]|nr:CoA pyrophosphatase [Pseudomonadota bacterium]
MGVHYSDELRERIAARLGAFAAVRRTDTLGLKRAAVVVAVVALADQEQAIARRRAGFLLTRRASTMRAHGGQLALPGGRIEDVESVEQAALRELSEEVGIEVGPPAILGALDDYPTRSGYLISPIVVWVPRGLVAKSNAAEVAEIYEIPLAELKRGDSPEFFAIPESDRLVIRLPVTQIAGYVNAPTAAVLYQFREVALEGRQTRVDHFDQPVWAWR